MTDAPPALPWAYDQRTGVWHARTDLGRYTARFAGFQYIAQLEGTQLGVGTSIEEARRIAEVDHAERLRRSQDTTVVPTRELVRAMRALVAAAGTNKIRERDVVISTVNRIAAAVGIDVSWEQR